MHIYIQLLDKKYRKEKDKLKPFQEDSIKTFIPVEVSRATEPQVLNTGLSDNYRIGITYPNGVHLSCPVNMDVQQIKTLIKAFASLICYSFDKLS